MNRFSRTILLAGLFAGAVDLFAAYVVQFIKTGQFSSKLLHYIAGGAIGLQSAMKGGFRIGLAGLFLHFLIAVVFTLFYFLLYPKLRLQRSNPFLMGLIYGLFVNSVMTFLVLPLSRLPQSKAPFNLQDFLINGLVLSLALGIPVALSANRFYARQWKQENVHEALPL